MPTVATFRKLIMREKERVKWGNTTRKTVFYAALGLMFSVCIASFLHGAFPRLLPW